MTGTSPTSTKPTRAVTSPRGRSRSSSPPSCRPRSSPFAKDRERSESKWHVQQAPGLWRTDLQEHDLSVPGRMVIQNRVELGPEAPVVRHKHPGEEIIYVLEGTLEYAVDGQEPKTLCAGEAPMVPADTVHAVRNVGTGKAAELGTYVVEKGKAFLEVVE
jgi:quercetin dioxygenase-like cupin family protein